MSNSLLIIDPQNDFCSSEGTLYVPGAEKDCLRLATFIRKNISTIDSIHITLDTHHYFHIAHPSYWRDKNGLEPELFTTITQSDFEDGKYRPVIERLNPRTEEYLVKLESLGKFKLTIWPPHCLAGSWGHNIDFTVLEAVKDWEKAVPGRIADIVIKGINPLTEHYSAIQAEVVDGNDPSTKTNFDLIDKLKSSEKVFIAGQALSHCVKNTVNDLMIYLPPEKLTLLQDCSSPVTGFESIGADFIRDSQMRGLKTANSDLVL